MTPPALKTTKSQRLARKLRQAIAAGEYPPATFLPSERDLAEIYETSRKTVGDALGELAQDGLVIRAHGRGTQVTPSDARTQQTTVHVIHPLHPKSNVIWGEAVDIMRGIEEALDPTDYNVDNHCIVRESKGGERRVEMPAMLCPSVFLEAGHHMIGHIEKLLAADVPFVVANMERRDLPYACTWTDHAASSRQAVRLLYDMGHRRIAYIGTQSPHLFYEETERGYIEAMRNLGLGVDQTLMARTAPGAMPLVLAGYHSTQHLLQLSDRPTGIVAARDAFAQGAWIAAEQQGLTVGVDISIVGYDDVSTWGSNFALTTFREPCYEMGAKAVEMLIDRMVNGPRPLEQFKIDADLVIRQSAGPAPRTSNSVENENQPLPLPPNIA